MIRICQFQIPFVLALVFYSVLGGAAQAASGTISATNGPNLVIPSGSTTATTIISWTSTGTTNPSVKVSKNGVVAAGSFSTSPSSTGVSVPWIATFHYVFTLYDGTTALASVSITGVPGTLSASPASIVLSPGSLGTSTITWNSLGNSSPTLKVSRNGGTESTVSSSASGTTSAPWIASPSTYLFTLYNGTTPLATTSVSGAPGTITASPANLTLPSNTTGTTMISWNAGNATSPNVKVSVNGAPETVFSNMVNQGSQSATWIDSPKTYTFTVYDGTTKLASTIVTSAPAFHSTYYHSVQASFWAQLADDTGTSPTPRQLAISSIQNNFSAIKAMGFDTVTIGLKDSDSWVSRYGGGPSYDPRNASAARPQVAIAQEIILRIASANQLKVIFTLDFSLCRESTDGRSAWAGLADQYDSTTSPPSANDYIHAWMDPTGYYGSQTTTKLETIGLTNGPVISHIGDARIIGWLLSPEWQPYMINPSSNVSTHQYVFQKYWNYFYNLVHAGGATNAFAGTYVLSTPGREASSIANIKAIKQWFGPGSGVQQPDMIGLEFYGYASDNYDLTQVYPDLTSLVLAMEQADAVHYPGDYAIAPSQIFFGEGSTDETTTPGINQFFQNVEQVMADTGIAGTEFWISDTLQDYTPPSGPPTLSPYAPAFDMFSTSFVSTGTRTYTGLPTGTAWHDGPVSGTYAYDPTNFTPETALLPAAYGTWTYTGLTYKGYWIQQALANHAGSTNLTFYANPCPVQGSGGTGTTTLYWDASKMAGVTSVQVYGGATGNTLVGSGSATGNVASVSVTDGATFYLVNVTGGVHTQLGLVTVQVQ